MKKKSSQKKVLKQFENSFVNNWSPYQQRKQYNALEDPHANYYFYNKSVNKHLKQLRKAVNLERNAKHKQKLKQLITSKLTSIKLPNIKPAIEKTSIYANQINKSLNSIPGHYRRQSDEAVLSNSRQNQNKNQSSFSVVQISRIRKDRQINYSYRQNKTDTLKSDMYNNVNKSQDLKQAQAQELQKNNRQSHAKFLKFLIERKKILINNTITNFSMKTEFNEPHKLQTQTQ